MPEYVKHPDLASHTEALYEAEDYHLAGGTAKKVLLETDSDSTPAAADMTPISKDWAKSHQDLIIGAHGATATPTANKIPIADASGKLDSWVTSSVAAHEIDSTPHAAPNETTYVRLIGGSGSAGSNGGAIYVSGPDAFYPGGVHLYTINAAKNASALALEIAKGDAVAGVTPIVNIPGSLTVAGSPVVFEQNMLAFILALGG